MNEVFKSISYCYVPLLENHTISVKMTGGHCSRSFQQGDTLDTVVHEIRGLADDLENTVLERTYGLKYGDKVLICVNAVGLAPARLVGPVSFAGYHHHKPTFWIGMNMEPPREIRSWIKCSNLTLNPHAA